MKAGPAGHYQYGAAPPDVVARVAAIETICDRYGVPLAAAALQLPLAHPQVASIIPGMDSRAQVVRAITMANTPIPVQLWSDLKESGLLHPDAPTPGECKSNEEGLA